MDNNVEVSKRKPRQARGTPSYYYRNRFAFAFLAAGIGIFAILASSTSLQVVNQKIAERLSTPSEEELERRAMFTHPAPRRSNAIRRTLEEKEQLKFER